jgi:hypothetical protein
MIKFQGGQTNLIANILRKTSPSHGQHSAKCHAVKANLELSA